MPKRPFLGSLILYLIFVFLLSEDSVVPAVESSAVESSAVESSEVNQETCCSVIVESSRLVVGLKTYCKISPTSERCVG
jgi:hypothetical protein